MIELQKQNNHDYLTSTTLHMVPLSRTEKKLGGTQTDF